MGQSEADGSILAMSLQYKHHHTPLQHSSLWGGGGGGAYSGVIVHLVAAEGREVAALASELGVPHLIAITSWQRVHKLATHR